MAEAWKRICARLVMVFAAALLCTAGSCSAKVHRGTWENAKWSYDTSTRTLTISCRGKMLVGWEREPEQEDNYPDWRKWYNKAKKVVFTPGITHISREMAHFIEAKEVVLPEGLVSIGDDAFWDYRKLKKIRFPASLRKIGKYAFRSSTLESVDLRNVEKVGEGAFWGGRKIKNLTIPSTCRAIKGFSFWCCMRLRRVKIENGLQEIGKAAFQATALKSVTIPPSVTKIGMGAFGGIPSLKRVTIQSKRIKEWGSDIFKEASSDLVIQVPKSKLKEYTEALREGGLPDDVKIVGKKM